MVEYIGAGARLMMLVLHDDAQREYVLVRRGSFTEALRRSEEELLERDQHEE